MFRVRVVSNGWVGAPGLSTFYFTSTVENATVAADVAGRVRTFYNTISNQWRSHVTFQVSPQVDVVNPVNGQVTASFIITTPAVVTGTSVASLTGPPQVAVLVRWLTGNFEAGRRIVGRTFLTQMAASVYDSQGQVATSTVNTVTPAAVALIGVVDADPQAVVWRRPRLAEPGATPPVTARDGAAFNMTEAIVPTKPATLNSRRDAA